MGKYFLMSMRFNKSKASDFGLLETDDPEIAMHPNDGSSWKKCHLFDYGWGAENGYCLLPELSYDKLLNIVIEDSDEEDTYGAASVILEKYPEKLLVSVETLLDSQSSNSTVKKLASVFSLQLGMNLSPTNGKMYSEIKSDANRWTAIANATSQKKRRFWFF